MLNSFQYLSPPLATVIELTARKGNTGSGSSFAILTSALVPLAHPSAEDPSAGIGVSGSRLRAGEILNRVQDDERASQDDATGDSN
jgi:hypothetical protein